MINNEARISSKLFQFFEFKAGLHWTIRYIAGYAAEQISQTFDAVEYSYFNAVEYEA